MGVDYSNGRNVICKKLKDGTIVWTKYKGPVGYEDIYAKYTLHHDKVLFIDTELTLYTKNYFLYFKPDDGWLRFWEGNWYCFKDIPIYTY